MPLESKWCIAADNFVTISLLEAYVRNFDLVCISETFLLDSDYSNDDPMTAGLFYDKIGSSIQYKGSVCIY